MTSIDKTTIPIGKAAIVMIFVCGLLANWFMVNSAMEKNFSEFKSDVMLQLQDLRNENKAQNKDISSISERQSNLEQAAATYLSEGNKPDEVKRRNYNNRRN
jgi:hypothetical protein